MAGVGKLTTRWQTTTPWSTSSNTFSNTPWRGFFLVLLALAALGGLIGGPASAATGAFDAAPADITPLGSGLPGTINPDKPGAGILAGNPLWAVPLNILSMTRERPLFSPSRRPIPAAVAAAPMVARAPPPKPPEPDHPPLTLVGTIVGGAENIAIFADEVTKSFVRLKTGQDHAGWTLRAILGRETTFARGSREATLGLPARGVPSQTTAAIPAANFAASRNAPPLSPPPAQAAAWRDGDGQLISPPPTISPATGRPMVSQ
jgi:hypothetical protein